MNHYINYAYSSITLSPLTIGEIEFLRILRNNQAKSFFQSKIINAKEQQKWFSEYLSNDKDYMFVVKNGKIIIGYCAVYNIDLENKTAEVGRIMVDDKYKFRGYGSMIVCSLKEVSHKVLGLNKIYCYVKKENDISCHVFKKSGFAISYSNDNYVKMECVLK